MRCLFFNFVASLMGYKPFKWLQYVNWFDTWIVDGCEKYTPADHRWRNDPMF